MFYNDSLPNTAGSWYLTEDVTLSADWMLPEGTVDLCLNGHTVTLGSYYIGVGDVGNTGSPIISTLNLCDCSDVKHYIKGFMLVDTDASIMTAAEYAALDDKTGYTELTGGLITGGNTISPPINVSNGGFNMYGGNIAGNRSGHSAAGVNVGGGGSEGTASFNMYGGAIANNSAGPSSSGGIMTGTDTTVNISGGTVTRNLPAGVWVSAPGTGSFTLSGSPNITGNRHKDTDKPTDLLLGEGAKFTVDGPLDISGKMYVRSADTTPVYPIVFTHASSMDDSVYFEAYDSLQAVQGAGEGSEQVVQLIERPDYLIDYRTETVTFRQEHYFFSSSANVGSYSGEILNGGSISNVIGTTVYLAYGYNSNRDPVVIPARPVTSTPVWAATPSTVTVTAVDGYEYKLDDGDWQTAGSFTGLTANTEYTLSYRIAATKNSFVSEVGTVQVATLPKYIPTADKFDYAAPSDLAFTGTDKTAGVTVKGDVHGMGSFTVKYYDAQGQEVSTMAPGTYTVKIDVAEGEEYAAATGISAASWTFTVAEPPALSADDLLASNYLDYSSDWLMEKSVVTGKGCTVSITDGSLASFAATAELTAEGEHEVKVYIKIDDGGAGTYKIYAETVILKVDSTPPTAPELQITGGYEDENGVWWISGSGELTVTVDTAAIADALSGSGGGYNPSNNNIGNGFISFDGGVSWVTDSYDVFADETTIVIKVRDSAGNIYTYPSVELKADSVAPAGEIQLDSYKFSGLSTVFFEYFYKDKKTVTIAASDESSGVAKIEYVLTQSGKNTTWLEEYVGWTPYNGTGVTLHKDGVYVVYARITDNVGNVTYIGSDGIVVYTDSSCGTGFITYAEDGNVDRAVTLTLSGNGIGQVLVNGTPLTENTDYTVSGDTVTFLGSYLDTLTERGYDVEVTILPQGKACSVGIIYGDVPAPVTFRIVPEVRKVTFDANGGSASATEAETDADGKIAALPRADRPDYVFDGWYTAASGGVKITADYVFPGDMTVYAHWTHSPLPEVWYVLDFMTYGGTAVEDVSLLIGTTEELDKYVTSRPGYVFTGWYDDAKLTIPLESITMWNNNTVHAGWERIESPFTDVSEDDWFFDEVMYVYREGLMDFFEGEEFSPYTTITRGAIVEMLYTLEGRPAVSGENPFADVPDNMDCHDAVLWAAKNGIVEGYDETTFGPGDAITREQFATILWRYAKVKGYDVSVGESTNILSWPDAFDVSEYAIEPMQWATGEGIITGADGLLLPQGEAIRCEAATMFMRFMEGAAKK